MNDKIARIMSALALAVALGIGAFIALGGLESVMPLANTTISNLTEFTVGLAVGDNFVMDDVSNSNATRKITARYLLSHTLPITSGDAVHTGSLAVDTTTLVVDDANNRVGFGTASPATDVEIRTSDAAAELRLWSHDDSVGGSDVYIQLGHKVNGALPDNEWYMGLDASDQSFSIGYGAGTWGIPGDDNVLTFPIDGSAHLNNSLQVTNSITATTWVSVGTFLKIGVSGSPQSISNGTGDILPTGSYHQITSGATAGNTLSTSGFTKGDYVIIENVGGNTITISDTGTTALSSDFPMTQGDILTLLFNGTDWKQMSKADNDA